MRHLLVVLSFLVGVIGAPAVAAAGAALEPAAGRLIDIGSGLSLGLGVSPLRTQLPAPLPGSDPGRPADADTEGTAVSLDLGLRWPGAQPSPLEPYLVFGPALFVVEPDYAGRLLGTRVDPSLQLGARAGAGVNWRLGRDVTLFGAWEVTTTGDAAGGRAGSDPDLGGHDFNYGVRLRF